MSLELKALHVVEKNESEKNLVCENSDLGEWETGNWIVSNSSAESLIGELIYVHRGQNYPSHIGGEIIDYRDSKEDSRRKIFLFKELPDAKGVITSKEGWGNERKYVWADEQVNVLPIAENEESSSPEGVEKYKLHRTYERDAAIVHKAKLRRLRISGKLECEVCSVDFRKIYGPHGDGYIEAHHKLPVSQLGGLRRTRISDLALVCSNCHRMLHRGTSLLTV